MPKEGLVREGSKLFGFARTGTQVELAMKRGIDLALNKGVFLEKEGRILMNER